MLLNTSYLLTYIFIARTFDPRFTGFTIFTGDFKNNIISNRK